MDWKRTVREKAEGRTTARLLPWETSTQRCPLLRRKKWGRSRFAEDRGLGSGHAQLALPVRNQVQILNRHLAMWAEDTGVETEKGIINILLVFMARRLERNRIQILGKSWYFKHTSVAVFSTHKGPYLRYPFQYGNNFLNFYSISLSSRLFWFWIKGKKVFTVKKRWLT